MAPTAASGWSNSMLCPLSSANSCWLLDDNPWATSALRELSFADNAGLVSNVVKLGAPLPGRALPAMDRVLIFDGGTVVRGLAG